MKQCKHDHDLTLDNMNKDGICKKCIAIRQRKWQIANSESEKIRKVKNRLDNIERARAKEKQWKLNNPEKVKDQQRRWRERNLEKVKENNQRTNLNETMEKG